MRWRRRTRSTRRSRPTVTASAIRQRLAAADPGNAQGQRDLAVSHRRLASVHLRRGAAADALVELRKGRAIVAALLAIAPDNAQWKNDDLAWFDGEIARIGASEAGKN